MGPRKIKQKATNGFGNNKKTQALSGNLAETRRARTSGAQKDVKKKAPNIIAIRAGE